MTFKKTILDKGSKKRKWGLVYLIDNNSFDVDSTLLRSVDFRADTHKEACDKVLRILKKSAKRTSQGREYGVVSFIPSDPLPGKKYVILDDELYRLKFKYRSPKKILKVKDPQECFVRGYGPEIAKKLEE